MASEWNWKRGEECDKCGKASGPFRETAFAATVCVDLESCLKRQERQFGKEAQP